VNQRQEETEIQRGMRTKMEGGDGESEGEGDGGGGGEGAVKNTSMGSHCLLQGNFPRPGSNPSLLHCRQIIYSRMK